MKELAEIKEIPAFQAVANKPIMCSMPHPRGVCQAWKRPEDGTQSDWKAILQQPDSREWQNVDLRY